MENHNDEQPRSRRKNQNNKPKDLSPTVDIYEQIRSQIKGEFDEENFKTELKPKSECLQDSDLEKNNQQLDLTNFMNNPSSFQNLANKPKPGKKRNQLKSLNQQSRDGGSSGQWSNSRTETVLT